MDTHNYPPFYVDNCHDCQVSIRVNKMFNKDSSVKETKKNQLVLKCSECKKGGESNEQYYLCEYHCRQGGGICSMCEVMEADNDMDQ